MSDDQIEKEQPEDKEKSNASPEDESSETPDAASSSNGNDVSAVKYQSAEAEEIDLEPVGSDEGPSGGPSIALGQGSLSEKDEKLFASLAHFLAIISSFVGPLVIWLIKKEESPFVDDHGKEALNFQLTVFIGFAVSAVLSVLCIGYFMMMGLMVLDLIFCIMAGVAANEGKTYRYPCSLRLIK